jgi:hypothetical protein
LARAQDADSKCTLSAHAAVLYAAQAP